MISLVPIGLGAEQTAQEPAPIAQKIKIQAISLRDALLVGVVTGFALAVGQFIFKKTARRFRWE